MSDPQQPGPAGDDQIPPIPPAPTPDAVVPTTAPASEAELAPVAAAEVASPIPPVEAAPAAPVNPYAPPVTSVPSSAPQAVESPAPTPPNPYLAAAPAAPVAPAYAAAPAAPAYTAAPGGPAAGAPGYAAAPGYPAAPSRFNVLGLVSLILGGISLLLGWIPLVGFFFAFLALVGLVLGIVGLIVKNKAKGLAIAGTVVSGLAFLISLVISIAVVVGLTSLSETVSDFGPDDPVITNPDGDGTGDGTGGGTDSGGLGSQENPAASGDTVTFTDLTGADEWQIVAGTPVLDATAQVVAENQFNAPESGNQLVLVPITYSYIGADSGTPFIGVTPQFLATDGALYGVSFASYPDSLYDAPALTPGASTTVNVIFEVPTSTVSGGLLQLSSIWGADPIYVALG